MKSLIFLANAGSPHVRQWSVCMRRLGIDYSVATIHQGNLLADTRVCQYFPWLLHIGRAGELISYVLLGLWLRLRYLGRRNEVLLHAHNTSGYGLAAWLSGCTFIVTTYGSEIYTAPARGGIYRRLIQAVLDRARIITASAPAMASFLQQHFSVPDNRLHAFTLGIDSVFYPDLTARIALRQSLGIDQEELVWIYNRRITPLYNTLSVATAFRDYYEGSGSGHLILLEGDCDPSYRDAVRSAVASCSAVTLVSGFLDQETLRGWLSAADFCISVPTTDQLSSSILEGIACGCLPVLLDNPAYLQVTRSSLATVVPIVTEMAFRDAFVSSAAKRDLLYSVAHESRVTEILGEEFHIDIVCEHVRALYGMAQSNNGVREA
ncbi:MULTISPECIES: glycosyltransferase family 4 protein [unclassified Pseudomonas]|uniref:glycosyltransferase family 4 protein n=1 Tax=unclassified Pseudomonas TaxID=196821 RepID=UPI0035BFE696